MAPELLGGVVYASDAYLVGEDLRERFNKVNRVRIFQLHHEIATLSQGTSSVSVYFSILKGLWHEYDVLVPFPNCCEKLKEHVENLHQQRVMQFLSGLNESYDQIEPLAMQEGRGRGRRQNLQCEFCHLKGHTKENYYKIVSYPADFFPRRRYGEGVSTQGDWQQNPRTRNQNIWNGTNNGKSGWNNPNTGKQGGNSGNVGKPGGWRRERMAMINNADESNPESNMENMEGAGAGEVNCLMSNFTQKSQEKEWVVDSGATHHITSNLELLSDVKCIIKTDRDRVHLPTGEQADITHIGSATLLDKREIKDVLYAPNFKSWYNSPKQLPLHSTEEWHSGKNAQIKSKENGEVKRFKARLVGKGYSQREGLDYHDTLSPVAKMVTMIFVISLAASKGWNLFQMDIYNAFLQGDLNEEVYMAFPEGFRRQGEKKVCKLLKSLYGLKQASRQWNIKMTEASLKAGFQ
nr:uncharacterized protein LOC117275089 [Nicotiana tomentosiformis]